MSYYDYERLLLGQIDALRMQLLARPLNLGGVSAVDGGAGGPPGGFIGYLPQTRVAYDETEAASSGTSVSGSLLDNLNHIRSRIYQLETDPPAITLDPPVTISGQTGPQLILQYGVNDNTTFEHINNELYITASGGVAILPRLGVGADYSNNAVINSIGDFDNLTTWTQGIYSQIDVTSNITSSYSASASENYLDITVAGGEELINIYGSNGVLGYVTKRGTGTIERINGVTGYSDIREGIVTNLVSVYADTPVIAGGTATNVVGVDVEDQSGGTNNYSIRTAKGTALFNKDGNATSDFIIKSDTKDILVVDASEDKLSIDNNYFTTSGIFINAPVVTAPKIHVGGDIAGFENYELTSQGTNGGFVLKRTGTNEPFVLLSNDTANSGGQIRGSNVGGLTFKNYSASTLWGTINVSGLAIGTLTTVPSKLSVVLDGTDGISQACNLIVPESALGSARLGLMTASSRQQAYIRFDKLTADTNRSGKIGFYTNPAGSNTGTLRCDIVDALTTFYHPVKIDGATDVVQNIIQGHSTQTANISEWQTSAAAVINSFGLAGAVFNEQGTATTDFRVESDTEENMIFLDSNGDTNGKLVLGGTAGHAFFKGGKPFGDIHVHDSAAGAQSINNGATYTKLTSFNSNGAANLLTTDAANSKIVLVRPGFYKVSCQLSFSCGTNNVEWKCAAFLNGSEQNQAHMKRKIGTAGDIGSGSFVGIIDSTTANWELDVRVAHDKASPVNITVQYGQLVVEYLGET